MITLFLMSRHFAELYPMSRSALSYATPFKSCNVFPFSSIFSTVAQYIHVTPIFSASRPPRTITLLLRSRHFDNPDPTSRSTPSSVSPIQSYKMRFLLHKPTRNFSKSQSGKLLHKSYKGYNLGCKRCSALLFSSPTRSRRTLSIQTISTRFCRPSPTLDDNFKKRKIYQK